MNPNLAGTVRVQFVIDARGNVATSSATGLHNKVAQCVASVVRRIRFPAPKGGGIVKVSYPFTFKSSTGGGAASQPLQPPPPPPPPPAPTTQPSSDRIVDTKGRRSPDNKWALAEMMGEDDEDDEDE